MFDIGTFSQNTPNLEILSVYSISVDEGGLCARFHEVQSEEKDSPNHWQSHNTGVVNFAYSKRELPREIAKLALAHEIGHSLGSPVSINST